jgi:hypothetical protein
MSLWPRKKRALLVQIVRDRGLSITIVPLLNPLPYIVIENPDQLSMPISSVPSSKSESVSRGEMRRELVSSKLLMEI